MRIAYIGLGTMGGPMVANLLEAGHEMAVHDVRRQMANPHLESGARWADSPREAARGAELILTSLPGPREVELVALGEQGIVHGAERDAVYADLSTSSPTLVRRIHGIFAERGVHVLDAPVSGGPRGAETRGLALWVGGDEPVFQQYRPVLEAIGDQPYYVGPIGAGSVAKLVHNCAGYTIQCALAEVFTMGVKAGVEPLALWDALRDGALGRQRTFDRLGGQFLQGQFDPPAFALRLAHKDVRLATELGRELQVPMRIANLTLEEMTEALNRGWAERDSRVAMLLQEERAGVDIAVPADAIEQVLNRS